MEATIAIVFHFVLPAFWRRSSRDFVLLRRYRRQWTPKTRHAFCIFVGAHGERLSIDARTAEITNLLKAWGSGDEAALARLTEHVYPELRLLARWYMKDEA